MNRVELAEYVRWVSIIVSYYNLAFVVSSFSHILSAAFAVLYLVRVRTRVLRFEMP